MKLIIEDDEGRRTIVPFLSDALSIGRADENQVRLGEKDVSRKHGRILRISDRYVVEDLGSFTGIRVNGVKVVGKRQINAGDLIQISEFDLQLEAGPDEHVKSNAPAAAPVLDDDETTPVRESAEAERDEATAVIRRESITPDLKTAPAVEIPVAEQPRLVGASGTLRGVEFPLMRSPVALGRALESDVCLDHPQVSRSHCRLALVGGGWKVIDAESRHGVKVNGEPYAASPLHHGDLLDVGPVRLVFALHDKPVSLPPEAPSSKSVADAPSAEISTELVSSGETIRSRKGPLKIAVAVSSGVIIVAAAVLLFGHQRTTRPEGSDEAEAALQRAGTAVAAHHYREAVRALQAAMAAGAPQDKTRVLSSLEPEAHAEEQYQQLVQAISRGDFDGARTLLDSLASVPTWFASRAAEHTQEVTSGYVKLHVDRANAAHGADDTACLAEANLALAANPQSSAARTLATDCSAAPAQSATARARATNSAPSAPAHPAPAAAPVRVARAESAAPASAEDEAEARRLLRLGNQEATGGDYGVAIANFERAVKLNPSKVVLGGLYRSLGATYSRTGNADEGARYYRLYLGYCDNPTEKAFLQKTLDDYDAARGRKK